MKALIFTVDRGSWSSTKGYTLADVPEPELQEQHLPEDAEAVIVEPFLAGVCGTDKGIWFRKAFRDPILQALDADQRSYRVAGHEILGKIAALGSSARQRSGLRIGDIVTAESHLYCGKCHACLAGDKHVCLNDRIIGVTADGGFAEKIKLPVNVLWKTNLDKIRPEVAAIQEPFGNAVHVCQPFPGVSLKDKNIAVFGCGTIGLFSIMIAKAMGARKIIGVEPNPINQEKARACGADHVILPSDHAAAEIKTFFATAGDGADFCFEMSGFASSTVQAIKAAGHGGSIVLFGLASGDLVIPSFEDFIVKGKRVFAVVGRRIPETWETSRRLLEDKSNGIQERIWNVLLEQGKGTILPLADFAPQRFEENFNRYSKTLIRIGS